MRASCWIGSVAILIALGQTAHSQILFEDDLDDNSAGWVVESLTGGLGVPGSSIAELGFDYADLGIPEAPNSDVAGGDAAQTGFRLRTNLGGFANDQARIKYDDASFAGQYTVEVDMWLNWAPDPNDVGTTLHGGVYVGDKLASTPANANSPVQLGAGYIATTDGDCSNCDHILLKNEFEMDTFSGQYVVEDFGFGNQPGIDNTDSDPVLDLPTIFPAVAPTTRFDTGAPGAQSIPAALDTQQAGVVGFQWVTVTADVDASAAGNGPGTGTNGTVTFSVTPSVGPSAGTKIEIGTVDNSQPDILDDDMDGDDCDTATGSEDICVNLVTPTDGDTPVDVEGTVSLFLIDFFAGGPANANFGFALFDNVTVSAASPGIPGDFDGDGDVDTDDFGVFVNSFQLSPQGGPPFAPGDFDEDGDVDTDDFGVFVNSFQNFPPPAVAVPEPSAAVLLAAAGLGALSRRRR